MHTVTILNHPPVHAYCNMGMRQSILPSLHLSPSDLLTVQPNCSNFSSYPIKHQAYSPRSKPKYFCLSESVCIYWRGTTFTVPMASQPTTRPCRCCRCNGNAKCLRCACVREGSPCTSCLPGDGGYCHNPGIQPPGSQPPPRILSQPGIPPAPITTPLNSQDCRLPPLATVLQTSIPTLKHVPKGARDR